MKKALNVTLATLAIFALASCTSDSTENNYDDDADTTAVVNPTPESEPIAADTMNIENMEATATN